MSPRHLYRCVSVDVAEQSETEALRVGGVGESVDRQGRLRGVERLSDPLVQLVVHYRAPESRLTVGDGLQV